MKKLLRKYKDIIAYLFFGVLATIVNVIIFYICAHPLRLPTGPSTIIAWFLTVIFAFFTNKLWVFESKSWKKNVVVKEATSFFLCRIATGVMDLVIMLVTVDILGWNDLIMKILSNILVAILNYVASKLVIFKNE